MPSGHLSSSFIYPHFAQQDTEGYFPLVDLDQFSESFLKVVQAAQAAQAADVLLCGEPALLCWLLYGEKPVFGYLGNLLTAYLIPEKQLKCLGGYLKGALA